MTGMIGGSLGHEGAGAVPPCGGVDTGTVGVGDVVGGLQMGADPPDGACGKLGNTIGRGTITGTIWIGKTGSDDPPVPVCDEPPVLQVGPTTETLKGKDGAFTDPLTEPLNDVLPHELVVWPVEKLVAGPELPKRNVADALLPVNGMTPRTAKEARLVDVRALARSFGRFAPGTVPAAGKPSDSQPVCFIISPKPPWHDPTPRPHADFRDEHALVCAAVESQRSVYHTRRSSNPI